MERESPNLDNLFDFFSPNIVFALVTHNNKWVLDLAPVTSVTVGSTEPPAIILSLQKISRSLKNIKHSKTLSLVVIPKNYVSDIYRCSLEWTNEIQSKIFLTRFKVQKCFYIDEYKVGTQNKQFPWIECKVKEIKRMIGYDHSLIIADVVHISKLKIEKYDKIMSIGRGRNYRMEFRREVKVK